MLRQFEGQQAIRQFVDEVLDPPLLVLEKFDTDMLRESWKGSTASPTVRYIAWHILKALAALHAAGFVHTGLYNHTPLIS